MTRHLQGVSIRCGRARRLKLLVALLALSIPAPVLASAPQVDRPYVASPFAQEERFAGDITYEFDSVLNRTTAAYRASLAKRDILHRLFFPPPDVHTIAVSYEYPGRVAAHVPDSVRIFLEVDEYRTATSQSQLALGAEREVSFDVGGRVISPPVSMVSRAEFDSSPAGPVVRVMSGRMQEQIQLPKLQQVHISRQATVRLSLCEFLTLTSQREMRGTVAGLQFSLDREVLAGLALFAAEMSRDSNDRPANACAAK